METVRDLNDAGSPVVAHVIDTGVCELMPASRSTVWSETYDRGRRRFTSSRPEKSRIKRLINHFFAKCSIMPLFASLRKDRRTTSSDIPRRRAISSDFNSGETLASSDMNRAQSMRDVFIVLTTRRIDRAGIAAMIRIHCSRAVGTLLQADIL